MKRVFIVCKDKRKEERIKKDVKKVGLKLSNKPELVISHGGDGTFLISERKYPGVLKLITKDSHICKHCSFGQIKDLLARIKDNRYKIREIGKLMVGRWRAVNDIIIKNKKINQAIRFKVKVDGRRVNNELIGDGVVVATPFGSSGYFYSITGKRFKNGIGIAFNNLNNRKIKELILNNNARVEVNIIRGDALIGYDNSEDIKVLKSGSKVVIKLSKDKARILRIK